MQPVNVRLSWRALASLAVALWRLCRELQISCHDIRRLRRCSYSCFISLPSVAFLKPFYLRKFQNGGRGGIRTHGGFPHARFRVECLKPDSATLPCGEKKTPNPPTLEASAWQASNVQHPKLHASVAQTIVPVWPLGGELSRAAQEALRKRGTPNDTDKIFCLTKQKNVTI